MTDNIENTITLIIDTHNHRDVSFRDSESANIFLNVYKTLFQDETQHIVDFSKEDLEEWQAWLDKKDYVEIKLKYTLRYNNKPNETEAVVEILEGLYNVEIIYI
jgi:hypothetical protein